MSSSVIALPSDVRGFIAPRAVLPSDSRLKKMLNQAVKRCHAMPMVMLRAITISQTIASAILNIAMK